MKRPVRSTAEATSQVRKANVEAPVVVANVEVRAAVNAAVLAEVNVVAVAVANAEAPVAEANVVKAAVVNAVELAADNVANNSAAVVAAVDRSKPDRQSKLARAITLGHRPLAE